MTHHHHHHHHHHNNHNHHLHNSSSNHHCNPAIINTLQTGFPITPRPFLEVAQRLALTETQLIHTIQQQLADGFLSRFGPLFNAEQMGGGLTLAAMAIPPANFEQVTEQVNAFPEVAHNYARDHTLNMWFVVATERKAGLHSVLDQIRQRTGYDVFNFPKLKEYHLGFKIWLGNDGEVDTVPMESTPPSASAQGHSSLPDFPDEVDRAIVAATQEGLPTVPQPYHHIADRIGMTAETVMARLESMQQRGWIRRIGVVPNHYRLGLRGNGMSVWDLPEEQVDILGKQVGALPFVSHCYLRPRYLPRWPFNLFAMVHGPDRESVAKKVKILKRLLGAAQQEHALLHSSRILKKTGLRLRKRGMNSQEGTA